MHILTPDIFSDSTLQELFNYASEFESGAVDKVAKDRIMATLFLEPSTRTRLSFESAMLRLGGSVISCSDANGSSCTKGETDYDSILTVHTYADVVVVRTPNDWPDLNVRTPANYPTSHVDIINAGDGGNHHPTQALTDAYTIWKKFGRLDNLSIGIAGDLKKSRTIHSFVELMSRYENNYIFLLDTTDGGQALTNPPKSSLYYNTPTLEHFSPKCSHLYCNTSTFYEYFPEMNVVYTNRIQQERHDGQVDGVNFRLSKNLLNRLPPEGAIVMNPGPRRDELPAELDVDPKVVFFQQARNGMFARMALLKWLLDS